MFDVYNTDSISTKDIKDRLGWANAVTTSDLVEAVILLCGKIENLERNVSELENNELRKGES